MITHTTSIYVDDAKPIRTELSFNVGDTPRAHVVLSGDSRMNDTCLYGTVAELREWLREVDASVSQAEQQLLDDANRAEALPEVSA